MFVLGTCQSRGQIGLHQWLTIVQLASGASTRPGIHLNQELLGLTCVLGDGLASGVCVGTAESQSGLTIAGVVTTGAWAIRNRQGSQANAVGDFAARLAERYEDEGDGIFADLDGAFLAVVGDIRSRKVVLARDHVGQFPLYYALLDHGIAFSSQAHLLLDGPVVGRHLDREGAAQYLLFGFLMGNKTLVKGIALLEAGCALHFQPEAGKSEVRRYFVLPSGDEEPNPAAAIDQIDDSLRTACRGAAAAGDVPAICLSAGLDSRVLLAITHREGLDLACVTNGVQGGIELELTSRMCRSVGHKHIKCLFGPDLVEKASDWLSGVVEASDGEASLLDIMMLYVARKYRHELGISHVIRGHGGELTKLERAYSFAVPAELALGSDHVAVRDHLYRQLIASCEGVDLCAISAADWRDVMLDGPRSTFCASYAKWEGSVYPGQCVSILFITEFLSRRMMSSMRCLRTELAVSLPFLDPKVICAILRSPLRLRLGTTMQNLLVSRNHAGLLTIPNSAMRVPLTASPLRRQLVSYAYRIARRLGYGRADVPERWIERRLANLFDTVLLSSQARSRDFVQSQAVSKLVRRYAEGEKRLAGFLGRMTMLELWMRRFMD
ncbi:MAG TPA: asparagine synthase-related protein [Phycisphaerae bacterium]|nr:asparagine synthase-related protein [Phycisphaerae bacterium]